MLNGWGANALLDSYELERRPVAMETISVATRNMSTLGPELADPRLMGSDDEFASAQPIVASAHAARQARGVLTVWISVLGTCYADSPIVVSDNAVTESGTATHEPGMYVPSAASGNRLPHKWLADHRSLYDTLGSEYSLIGQVNLPAGRQLVETAASLRIPLTALELDCHLSEQLFGAPLVLVRPDQHVAWRGSRAPDPEALMRTVSGRV